MKLQRQYRLASYGRRADSALQTKLAAQLGFVALPDSGFKFEYILLYLRDVAAAAQLGEFKAELLSALQMIYGSRPSIPRATMIGFYKDCAQTATKGEAVNPAMADEVRSKLSEEIGFFETLKQLYYSTHIDVPPSLLDSRLLLSNKDSKKLNRYEITLAHQFHNALDRFMEYRRFRLTLGGTGEQGLVSVEASPCGTAPLPRRGGRDARAPSVVEGQALHRPVQGEAPCGTAGGQAAPAEADDGSGGAKPEEREATPGSEE